MSVLPRLERGWWAGVPILLMWLLALLYLAFRHAEGLSQFLPALPLYPMFFWGVFAARPPSYLMVFLLGLVMDAVMGLPLGMSSLLYLLFMLALQTQRRFLTKEGFLMLWAYYALFSLALALATWATLSIFHGRLEAVGYALLQWGLGVCGYPAFHYAFTRIETYSHTRRWHRLHHG